MKNYKIYPRFMRSAINVYNKQIEKRKRIAFISAIIGSFLSLIWLITTIVLSEQYTLILFAVACFFLLHSMIYVASIHGFRKWITIGKYDWLEKIRHGNKINCVKVFWAQVIANDLLKV